MADDRRYSDEELALLLRRAVEMEAGRESTSISPLVARSAEGFTLEEVRGIAAEAGIDPALVAAAAASGDWEPAVGLARWAGGRAHLRQVLEVPASMTEAVQPGVVAGIRRAASHHGVVMVEPGALVWRSVGQPTQLDATLEPRAGSTRVTVTADRSGAAGLTALGSIGGWLVAAGITGAVLDPSMGAGVALIGSALAGGTFTARAIWSRATRRLQGRMAQMGEEVERALRARSAPQAQSESPDPTT